MREKEESEGQQMGCVLVFFFFKYYTLLVRRVGLLFDQKHKIHDSPETQINKKKKSYSISIHMYTRGRTGDQVEQFGQAFAHP